MTESMFPGSDGSTRGAGDLKVTTVVMPEMPSASSIYTLSPEQASFFKAHTGIDDDAALKAHILKVQEKAYKVFPYPCIQMFTFLEHGMAVLPVYESVLKLGRERIDGLLLDVGACFGVDARKAAADGYPLKNIITTDLHQVRVFGLGHDLFRTTPTSYPISFVAGDIFNPEILRVFSPFDALPQTERPDLPTLTSLNPLAGHCAAIYAGNVFHLFSEENQRHLASALAGLLSPLPGSVICGIQAGTQQEGGLYMEIAGKAANMFCHSPESWAAMWDGEVFAKGKVRVDATLERVEKMGLGLAFWQLRWSIVTL
ncbi:hypothetical protein JVU11DRAFT_2117 [Chiua virens]|nr:hypothetical protein JVU11DRAFT_2117 [Chiua virens]